MANRDNGATSCSEIAIEEAIELFEGDQIAAERWLSSPAKALQGNQPRTMLSSEEGTERVRALIHKLEHGIFI